MKLRKKEKTLTMAAAKAGMARNTARKYLKSGKLPSECRPERTWRTRPDPYESVWPEVEGILKRSPTVEATTVFDHLNRVHEGKFEEGQLRTLQRHIKQWRARNGELKEVMFPQRHEPGASSPVRLHLYEQPGSDDRRATVSSSALSLRSNLFELGNNGAVLQ